MRLFYWNTVKKLHLPIQLLAFEDGGYHWLIKARINQAVCSLILDTGASRTALDINQLERFGVLRSDLRQQEDGSGISDHPLQVFTGHVALGFRGRRKEAVEVVFMDLQHINYLYKSMQKPPVHGILGSDILVPWVKNIQLHPPKIHWK